MEQYHKYPRTPHLPWSPGVGADDIVIDSAKHFDCVDVAVTEKMDGENTTMYRDHIHARSIDSRYHESRNWVQQLWGNIRHEIPKGWRICGENVYAQHSIAYDNLESYFLGFSIWDERNICQSWQETKEWFRLLGIVPVPIWLDGVCAPGTIKRLADRVDETTVEGYVVRLAGPIKYEDFQRSFGKYVRKNHVQTDEHWMFKEVIPNKLRKT